MLDYLPTYVPMPCVGFRGKIHVSLDELRKRGHIAVKAASVESST